MLIEQGTNTGYHPSALVGTITADPIFNITPKGKHHCVFYVRYGTQKSEDGKYIAKTLLCEAWDAWADNCQCFEKNDNVVIFGSKTADEYRSQKTGQKAFKLLIEFAINAGTLYDATNLNNENAGISVSAMPDEPADESESVFFA